MDIRISIQEQFDYIKGIRRSLHKIPEESLREYQTQKFLLDKLKEIGPDSIDIFAGTGIRAVFYAKGATETIGFRADMDALCMAEETDHDYRSENEGRMHACGHDGHMSILLTFCKYISERKNQLKQNVVLLFQPGEEGTGGAKIMVDEGALENPHIDKLFGIHLDPSLDEGTVGTKIGYLMAATTEFDIEIEGTTSHGATPNLGTDAIVAASNLIMQLQTIVSRTVDPMKKAVVTIGKIKGGEARNIIAGKVVLEGMFRAYDERIVDGINDEIKNRLEGLEKSFGVKCEYKPYAYYPAVNNEKNTTEEVMSAVDKNDLVILEPRMIAEDFSFYQKALPACFMFLGIKKGKYTYPLHSNKFDFEEHSLLYGLEVYARLLGLED